ncbi:hypothetical protein EVAR_4708_1 [Eumeta japonica]|uniref:MADF domain-containing protein n=1 Tax=Eumeta variegata TaxID=151549 RepID=A0A4C1WQN1_EUMVA|nr:hypothetical protein EVAR_4708_1 [Eumeta japonica]
MGRPITDLESKKIFMATFRYHLRRKKESMKSGAGEDDVYQPIWVYYDFMESFLMPIYKCNNTINTEEENVTSPSLNEEIIQENKDKNNNLNNQPSTNQNFTQDPAQNKSFNDKKHLDHQYANKKKRSHGNPEIDIHKKLDLLPLKLRRPPLSLVTTQLNALREFKQPLVGARCEARFEARREANREVTTISDYRVCVVVTSAGPARIPSPAIPDRSSAQPSPSSSTSSPQFKRPKTVNVPDFNQPKNQAQADSEWGVSTDVEECTSGTKKLLMELGINKLGGSQRNSLRH